MLVSAIDNSVQLSVWRAQQVSSLFNVSSTNTTTATDPFTSILATESQLLTLSVSSKMANQANGIAEQSGDAAVMSGFQQAMQALFTQSLFVQSLDAQALSNLNTFTQLGDTAPQTFDNVFTNVNTLSQQGMTSAVQPYLNAVSTAYTEYGADEVDALNTAVSGALSDTTDTTTTLQTLATLLQPYSTTDAGSMAALTYNPGSAFLATNQFLNLAGSPFYSYFLNSPSTSIQSAFLSPVSATSALNLQG